MRRQHNSLSLPLAIFFCFFASISFAANTLVQTEQQAGWRVIEKSGAAVVAKRLPTGKALSGGWRIESIFINKDSLKICITKTDSEPLCADVFHPSSGEEGERINAALFRFKKDSTPSKTAKLAMRKAVASLPASVWTTVDREQAGVSDYVRNGWITALYFSLNMNEPYVARELLKSVKRMGDADKTLLTALQLLIAGHEADPLKHAESLLALAEKKEIPEKLKLFIKQASARLMFLGGEIEKGAKRFDEAFDGLEGAYPERCKNPMDAIELLMKREEEDRAVEAFRAVMKTHDDCKEIPTQFVTALLKMGRNDEAERVVDAALAADKDNTDLMLWRAAVLRRIRKPFKAMEQLRALNEIKPNNERVIFLHSTLASSQQDMKDYRDQMLARYEKDESDIFAGHAAGVMSYYMGEYELSKRLMDEIRPQLPTNGRTYIYGAMSRYQLGDWDGAMALLKELEKRGTEDPDLYYCYAMLYSGRDTEKARIALERFLADPVSPDSLPQKHELAWQQWEMLKNGKAPHEWLPGNYMDLKIDGSTDENGNGEIPLMPESPQAAIPAILLLIIGVIVGFFAGRKSGRKQTPQPRA